MKVKPVPTSPKVVNKPKKEIKRLKSLFLIMCISIIFGFFAGMLGDTVVNNLIANDINIPLVGNININDSQNGKEIIIKKELSEEEIAIPQSKRSEIEQILVTIYETKEGEDIQEKLYTNSEIKGYGTFITNDGWIITKKGSLSEDKKYTVINNNGEEGEVLQIQDDSVSEFTFIKTNLVSDNIATIENDSELQIGQRIYLTQLRANQFHSYTSIFTSILAGKDSRNTQRTTEGITNGYELQPSTNNVENALAFTLDGKFIGYIEHQKYVQTAGITKSILSQIVQQGEIQRNTAGITYLTINNETNTLLKTYGAYVTEVQENSPAETTGLQKEDVILSLDNQSTKHKDLAEIVQELEINTEYNLEILRDDESMTLKITLENL